MATTPSWQTLFIADDEATRWQQAKDLTVACVPYFAGAEADDLTVSILSGGITNQLLRVKRHSTGRSVVVRIFGKETDRIISRDAELFWQMASLETYGKCANGLVYEFLEGHVPLSPKECQNHVRDIAQELAKMHRESTARSVFRVPYSTQPLYVQVVLKEWPALGTSAEAVEKIRGRGEASAKALEDYGPLDKFVATANDVWQRVERALPFLPIVPCHNDLLAYNVMVQQETHKVRFIDFEYMRRNAYLYDIANHLVEWAGFECEWADLPTKAQVDAFLDAYVAEALRDAPSEEREAMLTAAKALLPLFMVAAHFAWSAWSLIQGAFSVIDFEYVAYGATKYKRALLEWPEAQAAFDQYLQTRGVA